MPISERPHKSSPRDVIGALVLGAEAETLGRVERVADGLATVSGLPGARSGEILAFTGGARGFVMVLEPGALQAVLLHPGDGIQAGSVVQATGQRVGTPVGDALLGRIIDPLGRPLDGGPSPDAEHHLPIERPSPAVIDREAVCEPLQTGILAVDALFALGRGQRELIIGERSTGKTSLAVDAIINQEENDVICVYVAIGQRMTAVARVIDALRTHGALGRCITVVASATAMPGLRWIAPFAATTMAEHFRDRGRDVLIVYDDLTKHAATHRELSLLARQPPGREAYPGDIFFLHARLLERSARLSADKGGGSLTALPIAEIEAGNLSAYIPTNLISISDGQIVLSASLFAANQRPSIDIGLSVSRVGGKAQLATLKSVAGRVRLEYAQYLELRMFQRFGGFADVSQRARIIRGERIGALLQQGRLSALRAIDQIALLMALEAGVLDRLPLAQLEGLKSRLPGVIDNASELADVIDRPDPLSEAEKAALLDCVHLAIDAGPAP